MKMPVLLGGLLVVQLALATGLFLRDTSGNVEPLPLLDFAVTDISRIVIEDDVNTATLARDGDAWQLPELAGLPANQVRIRTLLDKLSGLQTTWPVVETAAGRERFEVTEEKFQRRLSLYQDDALLGEYYFGTAPGFRQTHVRRAEDEAVYALPISAVDLPGDSNDWLDKSLLSAAQPDRIRGPDYELAKTGDAWQLASEPGDGTTAMLDDMKAGQLVSALTGLRVLRHEALPADSSDQVSVEVSDEAGHFSYQFAKAADKYYVKRSDREQAFTISQADYDRIAGTRRADLASAAAPAEETALQEQDDSKA